MPDIGIHICSPGPEIAEQWTALIQRAPANVFMTPAALNAAHATDFAQIHVLLAFDRSAQPERLVGSVGAAGNPHDADRAALPFGAALQLRLSVESGGRSRFRR